MEPILQRANREQNEVVDVTSPVRKVWMQRRSCDTQASHQAAYGLLIDNNLLQLDRDISYVYAKGVKRPVKA